MMARLVDALAANLEDEIEVQNALLEALRRQRRRLLEGGSDDLDEIGERIESLLERTDRNRIGRAALLRSAGLDPATEEPLNTLARSAPARSGQRLMGLRRMLVGLSEEVRSLNLFNAQLVRRSADVIESLLRVLIGQDEVPGYGLAGVHRSVRPRGVLVDQEI